MEDRVYFVIDMKSFFASVECAERGLDAMTTNLVVADSSRTEKTICLAVTPAMKSLGIKNRCRLFEIPRDIDYIIAKPRMKKYIEYASKIYGIYLKYIDKNDIHVYSIDECFIDATDYLKMYNLKAHDFAKMLMSEIYQTLHIVSSAGIGTNLFLAKIALDITAKHSKNRIGWLNEEKFKKTLWHHKPITDFWQISNGISNRLLKYGITDMAGIATYDENALYKEFGINAELIIDHAWGRESCLMSDIKNYKVKSRSVSYSQILFCNYNFEDSKNVLLEMVQNGCYDLARKNLTTSNIYLSVGYGDIRFDFSTASQKLKINTNLYSVISPYFEKLFDKIVHKNRPIRKVSFGFGGISSDKYEQYDLFTDMSQIEKEKNLVQSILDIHEKYGKNALLKGNDFKENATQVERNKMIGGHNGGEDENE